MLPVRGGVGVHALEPNKQPDCSDVRSGQSHPFFPICPGMSSSRSSRQRASIQNTAHGTSSSLEWPMQMPPAPRHICHLTPRGLQGVTVCRRVFVRDRGVPWLGPTPFLGRRKSSCSITETGMQPRGGGSFLLLQPARPKVTSETAGNFSSHRGLPQDSQVSWQRDGGW